MGMFEEFTRTDNDSTPQRVFLFSLLPILLGALTFLGWKYQVISWSPSSASAATLPVDPPAEVATDTSGTPISPPIAATSAIATAPPDSTTPGSPIIPVASDSLSVAASVFDEQAKLNNEALALATQKLQAAQAELSVTRRELEQSQWDVTLWKQQVATSGGERDHALQQVKDLTEQLRQDFLELNAAQGSLELLQRENAADKERLSQLLKVQRACQNRVPRLADN
jgi:hypothetical protein